MAGDIRCRFLVVVAVVESMVVLEEPGHSNSVQILRWCNSMVELLHWGKVWASLDLVLERHSWVPILHLCSSTVELLRMDMVGELSDREWMVMEGHSLDRILRWCSSMVGLLRTDKV